MNKAELIEALKDGNGLTKAEAAKVVNLFFEEISTALETPRPEPLSPYNLKNSLSLNAEKS